MMSSVSFSLTEKVIGNTIYGLLYPPLDNIDPPYFKQGRFSRFFQSEVVTRIIAIATSFFALIDLMAHVGIGIVKGAHLVLRKLGVRRLHPAPTGYEIAHHFKQSAKFLVITLIGSIATAIFPRISKSSQVVFTSQVDKLWSMTYEKDFEKHWRKASVDVKRALVNKLDNLDPDEGPEERANALDIIYRRVTQKSSEWPKRDADVFFHATSRKGLEKILKSGKVEVRREKAYKGAFVSTKPETDYGSYILVFNRSIERMSRLNHGFSCSGSYWAGFSEAIPVNEETLNRVLIHDTLDAAKEIAEKCKQWAGREIKVDPFFSEPKVDGDKVIPKEWPEEDRKACAILDTMRQRARHTLF